MDALPLSATGARYRQFGRSATRPEAKNEAHSLWTVHKNDRATGPIAQLRDGNVGSILLL